MEQFSYGLGSMWRAMRSLTNSQFPFVFYSVGLYWVEYLPLYKHLSVRETEDSFLLPSWKVLHGTDICSLQDSQQELSQVHILHSDPCVSHTDLTISLGNLRSLDDWKYYWWAAEGLPTVFVESWGNWLCTLCWSSCGWLSQMKASALPFAMWSKAGWWQLKRKTKWLLYPAVDCENCFNGLSPNFIWQNFSISKKINPK